VTGEVLCYVYAIVDASAPPLETVPGVDGTDLRTVEAGELAAVVSLVDRGRFNEESLEAALADLDRLEQLARSHHRVVDAIARQTPVAPLRMATILLDEPGVARLLDANRTNFTGVLERIRGREEWGVKAYATAVEPPDAAAGPAKPSGGPGTAYLARKRGQRDRSRLAGQLRAELAQQLHEALTSHSVAARLYPTQDPRLSGRPEPMALNAAYLVPAADVGRLRGAAAEFDCPSLRVELTGPWAPYSFAEVNQP
jgi:hypothetical protein